MLCVYGVVDAQHPGVEGNGVQGEQTRTVRADDLGAIVSDVGGDELLARRRDVEAHMSVLEAAHADGTVLPFRFGTVVEDDEAMRAVIRQTAPQYRSLLDRIRGRTQMTLKAGRSDDEAVRDAVRASPVLQRVVERSRGATQWADRVALGERVAGAVDELGRQDRQRIVASIAPLADAMVESAAVAPTVVSIALLMQPSMLGQLDSAVAELHDELGDRIRFDYAGPMPAYSFVT